MGTDIKKLQTMKISELAKIALELEIPEASSKKKQEIIFGILEAKTDKESQIHSKGVLEILPDGYGFLRSVDYNYLPGPDDVYISPPLKSLRRIHPVPNYVIWKSPVNQGEFFLN